MSNIRAGRWLKVSFLSLNLNLFDPLFYSSDKFLWWFLYFT